MNLNRINRFKVLEFPTDYEDFENIAPYNKLKDGKWTSLWLNKHPLAYKISHRFGGNYDGKLFWRELNEMKEQIEKLQEYQNKCDKETLSRRIELRTLIREQEKLCKEDNSSSRIDTILLSAISAYNSDNSIEAPLGAFVQQIDDAMNMMRDIISFIPLETCDEKLQKHLEQCNRLSGKYKCTKDHDTYMCQFMDIGRCEHFYEIQKYLTELERYECYDDDGQDKINELEYQYERALAVKEDRLREYLDNLYADDY